MSLLNEKIFDYLKQTIDGFEKTTKKGAYLFTCPNINNHKYKSKHPTTTYINGTDKMNCFICGFKGNIYDAVRILEKDKANYSDAQVTEYLINILEVDLYSEFNTYKIYNWSLLPIAKDEKGAIEKGWREIQHTDKVAWIKWLNNGLNIGLKTGKDNNIFAVDVDNKEIDETLIELRKSFISKLDAICTLKQKTPHGYHYIFKYREDIAQAINIGNLKIDIKTEGGYILVAPSKIQSDIYQWTNIEESIKECPEELANEIKQLIGKKELPLEQIAPSAMDTPTEFPKLINNNLEGCCNDTFVKLGGLLVNKFTLDQTTFILKVLNNTLLANPMPEKSIEGMTSSLSKYKLSDDEKHAKAVYDYLKLVQNDVSAKDIMDSLHIQRNTIDKYLSQFVKEGKAIRLARGRYKYREKVEWSDGFTKETGVAVPYKVPYFNELMDFEQGDIILIGGKTSTGKTHIALNILKQVIEQNIKPYYIYSESGSRHFKIAKQLQLPEGSFYHSFHANPLSIEIEPNSFTVLDWLLVSEKEHSDSVFKFFAEEMERKGGILVIMMQLKESCDWFAPNMVMQFPALASRHILDSEDGSSSHFQIDKLRDSKIGNARNIIVNCTYDYSTKILKKQDLI